MVACYIAMMTLTNPLRLAVGLLLLPASIFAPLFAQQPKQFDVVSIRESHSTGSPYSNFPLNPGPQYNNEGGLLVARNIPLLQLLVFAYAHNMYQIQSMRASLPSWARDTSYDVQARVDGTPTKDEMRTMVADLLTNRFHLKMHLETREVPADRLVMMNPGKLGPKLQPAQENGPPCAAHGPYSNEPVPTITGGLPAYCGAVLFYPESDETGQVQLGGRKVTLPQLATAIGASADMFDHPVLDGTGLTGDYDVSLSFTPEHPDPASAVNRSTDIPLAEALRNQLGLKLVSGKGPVEVVILDHLEKPTEN